MSVVILGGTGFLGRHLCQALAGRAARCTVVSHSPDYTFLAEHAPQIVAVELNTAESREALGDADTIVHFGHTSRPASNFDAEVMEISQNVEPAVKLFSDLARENPGVRVIYASTGGQIYGNGRREPISEAIPARPVTPYALGKHLIEQSLKHFADRDLLRALVLRLANPVGRWQLGGRQGFVSAAVTSAVSGKPLTVFGRGENLRDYFDAREFSDFLADLILGPSCPDGIFNIGTGNGMTEYDVLRHVEETLDRQIDIVERPPRPFDLDYSVLDITKARTIGWSPRVTLGETIKNLAERR